MRYLGGRVPNYFERFCEKALKHRLSSGVSLFHRELMNEIDKPLLAIGAPRRHGKSTIYCLCLPIFRILFFKPWRFQVVSQSGEGLADFWIREIMKEFERNEWILSRFGDLRGDQWSGEKLTFNHCSASRISGIGMGYQVRGFGQDEIAVDDPQGDKDVDSEAILEDHRNIFKKGIINTMEPYAKLKYIGTPINDSCLLMDIINQRDGEYQGFKHLWFPVMSEELLAWAWETYLKDFDRDNQVWKSGEIMSRNGEVLFPQRWDLKKLMQRRDLIGFRAFDSEYMLNPKREQDYIIRKESIEYVSLNGERVYKSFFFDPALTEGDAKASSFSALCMISLILEGSRRGKIHVSINEKRKVSPDSQGKWIVDFYQREHPQRWGLENVAYQKALKSIVESEAKSRFVYMPAPVLIKPDKDKRRRLEAVSFLFDNGTVVFDPSLKEFVENELLRFSLTNKITKDRTDALVYCLEDIKDRAGDLVQSANRIRRNHIVLKPQMDTGRLA